MNKMKIVCISDTHNQHQALDMPEGDMVIHSGDMTSVGKEYQVLDFLRWFSSLRFRHKILIAGNHDWLFEQYPLIAKELLAQYPDITYLEDSGVEIEGIKFWGSPVQPEFYDWAFNRKRGAEIKKHWDLIPSDTDVLITHGPPHGILDRTAMTKEHTGCEELLKIVSKIRPMFHIFGHIHSAAGIYKTEHTTLINASVLDDNYKLKYKPTIISI